MKKLMYIFLALPILTGCKEKKSAGAMGGMPTPEISVTKPIVEDITLSLNLLCIKTRWSRQKQN